MKGYFVEPHPNWSKTPDYIKTTWFKCFAVSYLIYFQIFIYYLLIINILIFFQQKWHWSAGITERVKAEFVAKAKTRLCNTVSDWKDKWEIHGYEAKPSEITKEVWDGLIAYWKLPTSIAKANNCSASRRTKDKDGNLPMVHRTGQKPHAGIRLEAVSLLIILNFIFPI